MKTQVKQKRMSPPTVKLGVSRQIVIPKKLYDALRLSPGSYLEVQLHKWNELDSTYGFFRLPVIYWRHDQNNAIY